MQEIKRIRSALASRCNAKWLPTAEYDDRRAKSNTVFCLHHGQYIFYRNQIYIMKSDFKKTHNSPVGQYAQADDCISKRTMGGVSSSVSLSFFFFSPVIAVRDKRQYRRVISCTKALGLGILGRAIAGTGGE